MSEQLIMQTLDRGGDGDRILDEFEQRTGLQPDLRSDGRYYELHDKDHRTRIVQTLTAIDPSWTDHVGFKFPA